MLRAVVGLSLMLATVGLGTAGVSPIAEASTVDYTMRVNPGGLSALTCGWHQGPCFDEIVGDALDWDNADNAPVYWRSFGVCDDACSKIASGEIEFEISFCYETRVRLVDLMGNQLGRIVYTHTFSTQAGITFDVRGSLMGWEATTLSIGTSVTDETASCGGTAHGSHVHEYHRDTVWTKNPQYPNVPGTGSYDPTLVANYQVEKTWTIDRGFTGDDTVGVVQEVTRNEIVVQDWYLRNSLIEGWPDCAFERGAEGHVPLMGDWNGDGVDTTGYFDPSTIRWHLRDTNESGPDTYGAFIYGETGDLPVAGDWDGNGTDTPGIFRPSNGEWHLRNSLSGPANHIFVFGAGTDTPVVGDWNGDGIDTVGVHRDERWLLLDQHVGGPEDYNFEYGIATDSPVVGDWDGDGDSSVGIVRGQGNDLIWHLSNDLGGPADPVFTLGLAADMAVTGDLDDEGTVSCEDSLAQLVPCGSNPLDATSIPERLNGAHAGADDDGDGATDEALPGGVESEDCDGDSFIGSTEMHVFERAANTDDQYSCPETATANDEADDRWPADFDDSQTINIIDVLALKAVFGEPASENLRYDLSPGGALINNIDVLALKPVFNTSCS